MKDVELELNITSPSPIVPITPLWPGIENYSLSVKRDDMLHPVISGNKWRKLKYALLDAQQQNIKHILSFGGGYSNHLHALAYCCNKLGIRLTAIIRGDYSSKLTPMLEDMQTWRTDIQWVDRQTYQRRDDPAYLNELKHQYEDVLIIPEGGSQSLALQGVAEIVAELDEHYDYIIAPVGSGGTLAGLINATVGLPTQVLGIAVLKGQGYLEGLVSNLLPESAHGANNWQINHDFHFGGYAKSSEELRTFCSDFQLQTHIPIEPVYSGKMFFALAKLIQQNAFPIGSKILALHTGGLQGARMHIAPENKNQQ
jgi:1-aminocyclopropane-1-carboxylate deaminase